MCKKITLGCFMFLLIITFKFENIYARDRVVLLSIPSDVWHQNIYLIADKLSWIEYRNFTVQVGDRGEFIYNFPNWYHGKYDPALYKEDINGDKLEDIIVVLNNDIAGYGKPVKDIHILNQIHDPYRRYEEAIVEPIEVTVKNHVKIDEHDNKVFIYVDKNKYNIDLSKYNYTNPREPYVSIKSVEYFIKNGKLLATADVYVARDNSVYGGLIGYLNIEYFWDGKVYKSKSIIFNEQSS
ncbi:hypothetical protein [Clostridium peptidivorans]|uniref:hypothetical protein n=1 Tax=Clostridium peptidivorans TaxID=100174 RepID=UPI000BE371C3|nr:hypothetical protein [Clostridium peptidivorans]